MGSLTDSLAVLATKDARVLPGIGLRTICVTCLGKVEYANIVNVYGLTKAVCEALSASSVVAIPYDGSGNTPCAYVRVDFIPSGPDCLVLKYAIDCSFVVEFTVISAIFCSSPLYRSKDRGCGGYLYLWRRNMNPVGKSCKIGGCVFYFSIKQYFVFLWVKYAIKIE